MTRDEAEVKVLEEMRVGGCTDDEYRAVVHNLAARGNKIILGWLFELLHERRMYQGVELTDDERKYMDLKG